MYKREWAPMSDEYIIIYKVNSDVISACPSVVAIKQEICKYTAITKSGFEIVF